MPTAQKEEQEAANPDKPVTGAEEEPVGMKPADPTIESAVSGGEALPPVAEDLRQTTKSAKPSSITAKNAKAAPSSTKAPVSTNALSKKASRSSLTAPTAASVARQAAADKHAAATAKSKPREVTKPVEISSRLTAPTAASRARFESASSTASAPAPKPAAPSKGKPAASSRPTPRTSLAGRPESRATQKPAASVDGSFLERMTRATAASSNRSHEKTEVKSPSRQKQLPLRPKTNGTAKAKPTPAATTGAAAETEHDATAVEDASILPEEVEQQPDADANATVEEPVTGTEQEISSTKGHEKSAAAVESTPAAMVEEEAVR